MPPDFAWHASKKPPEWLRAFLRFMNRRGAPITEADPLWDLHEAADHARSIARHRGNKPADRERAIEFAGLCDAALRKVASGA